MSHIVLIGRNDRIEYYTSLATALKGYPFKPARRFGWSEVIRNIFVRKFVLKNKKHFFEWDPLFDKKFPFFHPIQSLTKVNLMFPTSKVPQTFVDTIRKDEVIALWHGE